MKVFFSEFFGFSLLGRVLLGLPSYTWSVALYGCEAWTIDKGERRRLEAFETWCCGKLLKIS